MKWDSIGKAFWKMKQAEELGLIKKYPQIKSNTIYNQYNYS